MHVNVFAVQLLSIFCGKWVFEISFVDEWIEAERQE